MIAVVIPCYRVRRQIADVIEGVGPEAQRIYVVDDACPEGSGRHVLEHVQDPRVEVIFNPSNLGVGGAVKAGMRRALSEGAEIIVKLDGDGQADPSEIPRLLQPILDGRGDYSKGNRFYAPESLARMPWMRLFGNSVLSFLCKLIHGYWNTMDPTNGYLAVRADVLKRIPLDKLDDGYFFESDMLFRLCLVRAVVCDVPLEAVYQGERSNLRIWNATLTFPGKYLIRLVKRIVYNYFVRDFNLGSLYLVLGCLLLAAGASVGSYHWYRSIRFGILATAGTVMLAALPVIIGIQFLVSFLQFDVGNVPRVPLGRRSSASAESVTGEMRHGA